MVHKIWREFHVFPEIYLASLLESKVSRNLVKPSFNFMWRYKKLKDETLLFLFLIKWYSKHLTQCCVSCGNHPFDMQCIEWLVSIWNATLGWNESTKTDSSIFSNSSLEKCHNAGIELGVRDRESRIVFYMFRIKQNSSSAFSRTIYNPYLFQKIIIRFLKLTKLRRK